MIIAGLAFRMFGPDPYKPMGKLVEVNGTKFHILATGKKSNKPTLVIENGAGLSTEYYHWLSEGLKDSMRVVRYDRAGLGYSESNDTPRNPETIAKELHALLKAAGETPPYILAGHSFGGPYTRVFTQLYPKEVVALFLLDATHPEQAERFNAAPKSSFRFKSVIWGLNVATFFSNTGVLGLLQHFTGPVFAAEGLPDEINARTRDYLLNGKCLDTYTKETQNYHDGLQRAKKASYFDSIPVRVFTAVEINRASFIKRGIDPDKYLEEIVNAHKEYTQLSTNGKQFLIDGNHNTIFSKKENATIICNEVLAVLEELNK